MSEYIIMISMRTLSKYMKTQATLFGLQGGKLVFQSNMSG